MKYKNISYKEITDKYLHIFVAMSTRHFGALAKELGYPGEFDDHIRVVALDFSQEALPSIGQSTPFEAVKTHNYDKDRLVTAWDNAITHLERFEQAKLIRQWINTVRNEEQELWPKVSATSWGWLLYDWAMDIHIPVLKIAIEKAQQVKIYKLQEIVQDCYWQSQFPYFAETQEIEMDSWEEYLLYDRSNSYETWLEMRMRFQRMLTTWIKIFRVLSDTEIRVLDRWGYDMIKEKRNADTYFSLPDFAKQLQERNYY